jgi:tRNA uridine 5-carboxymethylaminomethyl modification enzyme
MMTSRSEFRLLLRQDNADARLTEIGRSVGLIGDCRYAKFKEKQAKIAAEKERLASVVVPPSATLNAILKDAGEPPATTGIRLEELIRRPSLTYEMLAPVDPSRPALPADVIFTVQTDIKYEGYIKMQLFNAKRFEKLENKNCDDIDYTAIRGLSTESAQKLTKFRPASIGAASRISGVSPADITVLLIYLDARTPKREENDDEK